MNWVFFLHFYQPANQQKDILEAVVKQSYLPIFKKIDELPNAKITVNISGALFELFERDGYTELINLISRTVKNGKVELTGSCKYHALLPLIPEEEIRRQVLMNEATINRFLGFDYKPKGFFPPEMAYDPKVNEILESLGYKWLILDESAAYNGNSFPVSDKLYKAKDSNLQVFFRNRRASNLIMSAVARDIPTLRQALSEDFALPYLITGMDGETFGHHRIGFENFLFDILSDSSLGITGISSMVDRNPQLAIEPIKLNPCTWASSIDDIQHGIQFLSWNDPANEIHAIQWKFLYFTLDSVKNYSTSEPNYQNIRQKMDIAMASDHFWWASAKPWWSLEMIEDGAYRLLDVVSSMSGVTEAIIFETYKYYMAIVSKAAGWQREGVVRKMAQEQNKILRIPFKERTMEKGGAEEGVYWAFIDLLKTQEKKAADSHQYEQAILWRDSIYKLENKQDIYDTINVIDLLRIDVGNGLVEDTITKYKDKYREIRGGQPEQRGS